MIEIIAMGLLGLALIFIPAIMIAKIKYFKVTRQKEFQGLIELFLPVSAAWWISAITFLFPIVGKKENPEWEKLRRLANFRLVMFYMCIVTVGMVLGL